jgi:outer membrane receptor protein involved in Fe transport
VAAGVVVLGGGSRCFTPEKLVHPKEFTMHSKHRAIRLALLASLAASGMVAAQTTTDQPATSNQPAPASTPTDPNIPADNSATGTAGGPSSGRKKEASEEIVVTGSRIRRKDLTTPAPVTVISREQITSSGKVTIGDFLQALPEQGNTLNTQFNNGGDGSTRIALRSLGSARTLVLVNGRRMVAGGTGADTAVDLNTIPTAAVERVEVLKDGASAVYGSDAIAGVVNIITRKGFKGTEASAYGGISQRGDGSVYDLNVTTGQASDRGNVVFSAGFYKQNQVLAGDRVYSAHQEGIDLTVAPNDPGRFFTIGSGTIPAGRILIPGSQIGKLGLGNSNWDAIAAAFPKASAVMPCLPGDAVGGCVTLSDGSKWRNYRGANLSDAVPPQDGFNFQPMNYNQTPSQRISLYSIGDLQIGSNSRGYFEASYVNRQSEQQLAPEPLIIGPGGLETVTVSKFNAYNPFGRDFGTVRRRLLEFGNRISDQDIDTFRVVAGLDGTLPDEFGPARGWFWDVSLNFGRTVAADTRTGNLEIPRVAAAVGPSMTDPSTGKLVCVQQAGVIASVIPGCVPLDLFHGAGSIQPDQVAGLGVTAGEKGINQMTAVQFNTSGELFQLPTADRAIGLAAGYEYRLLYGAFIPDPLTAKGEISGNTSDITKGGYHVNEGYAELSLPLLSNMPGVESLEATAAARVFNYSTFGTDYTYKFGARWRPIHDVTLRGTYSTAFRAPGITDLYGGQFDNFASVSDPCAGPGIDPNSTLGKACTASTPAALNNGDSSTQLRSRIGGNPALKPETAKVFTAGIVLEPTFVRNLSITVDYYNFALTSTIDTIGESVILNGCYPNSGASKYCDKVIRDPATGQISSITNLETNVGSTDTDGIDMAIRYALPTDFGRFGFLVDVTWLHKYNKTLADGTVIYGKGRYDLGAGVNEGVFPTFKGNGGVTFGLAGLNVGVSEQFIGSYKECGASDGAIFSGDNGQCYVDATYVRTIDPFFKTDIYASYALTTGAGKTTFAIGMNNAFNAEPPKIYNAFTPNSDPSAYDFMGRFVWGRLTQTF